MTSDRDHDALPAPSWLTRDGGTVDAEQQTAVDLDAYYRRTGYTGNPSPTLETLTALHFAHATSIPFENIDIQLGRPIRLDLASLQAKLVQARRGGYCFEQNTLFAAVLEAIGFSVTRLAARVRLGSTHARPRTHMLLQVDVDGAAWLVDTGFGADGLLGPIPLEPGPPVHQFAWTYQVTQEGPVQVLQSLHGEVWQDLYAFTLEEQLAADYVMANHYTSTHPNSPFVRSLVAQLPGTELRLGLQNRELIERRGTQLRVMPIEGDAALLDVLCERFGLVLPIGTRFRCLEHGG